MPKGRLRTAEREALRVAYERGGLRAAYAAVPDRDEEAVRIMLRRLGYDVMRERHRWTDEETASAIDAYRAGGLDAACTAVPHRRRDSVRQQLIRQGVYARVETHVEWTLAEVATLERMWREGATHAAIAKALGRTRPSVSAEAQRQGLPRRTTVWTAGRRKVVEREVDAVIERVAAIIHRTPGSVGHHALYVLHRKDDGQPLGDAVARWTGPRRSWTRGEYGVLAQHVRPLVSRIVMRFGCTEGGARSAIAHAFCSYGRRRRAQSVLDIGGMTTTTARPSSRRDAA